MKKIFLALMLFSFSSCVPADNKKPVSIIGKWKLTHTYADPGNGSGTWNEPGADGARQIEFSADSGFVDSQSKGNKKFVMQDSTHLQIISVQGEVPYVFTIQKLTEDSLQLRANCIEGCGEKYARIK